LPVIKGELCDDWQVSALQLLRCCRHTSCSGSVWWENSRK